MIVKRGKGYGVSVYDPASKSKRWVGTFATMRAARDAERTAASRPRASRVETCDSFAERWVGDFPRAAPATRRTYTYAVKRFAEDFRGVAIGNLDRPAARAWAKATPQSNVRAVRAMFNDAINEGLHPVPTRSRTCASNSPAAAGPDGADRGQLHQLAHAPSTCMTATGRRSAR